MQTGLSLSFALLTMKTSTDRVEYLLIESCFKMQSKCPLSQFLHDHLLCVVRYCTRKKNLRNDKQSCHSREANCCEMLKKKTMMQTCHSDMLLANILELNQRVFKLSDTATPTLCPRDDGTHKRRRVLLTPTAFFQRIIKYFHWLALSQHETYYARKYFERVMSLWKQTCNCGILRKWFEKAEKIAKCYIL